MNKRLLAVISLVAIVFMTLRTVHAEPKPVRYTFDETTEGWLAIPPPSGVPTTVTVTNAAADVKVGTGALKIHYIIEPRKIAGLIHPVAGVAGKGVRVWLKTDSAATILLGLPQKDASFLYMVETSANIWTHVEAPFTAFHLSEDSKDKNAVFDPEQVTAMMIADAGGFLPGAGGERTLLIDDFEVGADFAAPKLKPYLPLLPTGIPSSSGARATTGVTYRPGKFEQGMLASGPAQMVAVPVKPHDDKWRWARGTIEMWVCPQIDMSQSLESSALVTMQDEPFIPGLQGSLMLFYTGSHQVAFMLNDRLQNVLASTPLDWKAGEWHHVAISWGELGMRLYLDGKLTAHNEFARGPATPSADLVVGNQAWMMTSDRFANAVIDELRVSDRQRTDEEINTSATATAPLQPDADTLALEHFDGSPLPAIAVKEGATLNAVPVGSPVQLTLVMPGGSADAQLSYTISTPGSTVVRKGEQPAGQTMMTLQPFQSPGFYRIAFRLESGGQEINHGEGWFRITRPMPAAGASRIFGAAGCYADSGLNEEFFRHATAVGIRTLRLPFEWAEIEPVQGSFVWTKYDRIVNWAARYGVELIPTFIWETPQPAWAGRGKAQGGTGGSDRLPPENMAKWSAYVFAVVNRYKDRVHWWIPENEPNLDPAPDAKGYVALLKVTRTAVLHADPNAKILGCNVGGLDLRFLEQCFKEGALKYCDAVGVHPYICPHSPDEQISLNIMDTNSKRGNFREGLLCAQALIHQYGGLQKLWLDEVGQTYRDDFIAGWVVSEAHAAEYMAKIYMESLASAAVDRVLWFSFWGANYGSFSLLKPDGTPTLPMAAYVAAVDRLGDATFVKEGARGNSTRSLIFRNGNRRIETIWRPTGDAQITLQPNEHASDMYGFPIEGTGQLKVGAQPVYVETDGSATR
jgi:hypothetical protein